MTNKRTKWGTTFSTTVSKAEAEKLNYWLRSQAGLTAHAFLKAAIQKAVADVKVPAAPEPEKLTPFMKALADVKAALKKPGHDS